MIDTEGIRCTVVALCVSSDNDISPRGIARDLLPWADPYIALLIKNLQNEVRQERRIQALMRQRVRWSQSFPVQERAHLRG
jgi:hypothetical protein